MNLTKFEAHIKTVSHKTLDQYFDEITVKASRARSPQTRLGYALALEEMAIESEMRKAPVSAEIEALSDDELLNALTE